MQCEELQRQLDRLGREAKLVKREIGSQVC